MGCGKKSHVKSGKGYYENVPVNAIRKRESEKEGQGKWEEPFHPRGREENIHFKRARFLSEKQGTKSFEWKDGERKGGPVKANSPKGHWNWRSQKVQWEEKKRAKRSQDF